MMAQVSSAMIPDISKPFMTINDVTKQLLQQKANIKKVSMIGVAVRKRTCLKSKANIMPKIRPIRMETTPRSKNSPRMMKGVYQLKLWPCRDSTVLKSMIETMSLNTPSPKMHEKSFGYASQLTMETAATTSDEQSRAVSNRTRIVSIEMRIGPPSPASPVLFMWQFVICIFRYSIANTESTEQSAKQTKVTPRPKIAIFPMF